MNRITNPEVIPMLNTFLNVVLVIMVLVLIALVVLYFLGRKMEKRQMEQQAAIEAAAQTVSMLIIDKKKLRLKEAGKYEVK